MTPKLSILICTLPNRSHFYSNLITSLYSQRNEFPEGSIEILADTHATDSIGTKRNRLLQNASGDYVAFIDDDDRVSDKYFKLLFQGIEKGVDCCSLKGIITEDGKNPLLFEHSIKYKIYRTITDSQEGEVRYERYPNHLNCIKRSIAWLFKFPEKNHGEDTDWATEVFKSGLIKTEHYIPEVIYYYDYRSKK